MGKGVLLMRWAIGLCYSAYVGFAIVPLLARTQEALRRAAILSLLTLEFAFMMFLVIPLLLTPHLPAAHEDLWMWTGPSRESKGGWEYFPSFPAMFALLFSDVLKLRWSQLRWLAYGWVVVVAIGSAIVAQDGRSACSER